MDVIAAPLKPRPPTDDVERNSPTRMSDLEFSEERWRLESALQGNRESLEKLLDPLRPKLTAFFAKRVKDADEAEALAQQTLVQAYQQLADFRHECPFERWVWCIAGNIAVQHYRARSRAAAMTDSWEHFEGVHAAVVESDLHVDQWLKQVIAAASEACSTQEVSVMMTFYQVGSFERVAELLELNAATVRSSFYRGRGALLSYLIRFLPEAVGGRKLIFEAAKKLLQMEGEQALDHSEYDILMKGGYPSKLYRTACIKVARELPNPFQVR